MSFGVTLEATTMPAGPAEGRWVERCRGVRDVIGARRRDGVRMRSVPREKTKPVTALLTPLALFSIGRKVITRLR